MNKNRKLSYEEKFEIICKYLKENNAFERGIKARTVYNGHRIGEWQSRMRTLYYKGELKLDKDLEEKLLKYGILKKEKEIITEKPISWEEKFQIMSRYLQDKSNKKIKQDTMFEGYKIGVWQRTIRHLFYTDNLKIDKDLENKFFECGILRVQEINPRVSSATKTSYEEKFEIMHRYLKENNAFREGIHQSTVYEGQPIGVWQDNMRQAYYKGKLKLAPDLEEMFLNFGILRKEKMNARNKTKKVQDKKIKEDIIDDNKDEIARIINEILEKQKIISEQEKEIEKLKGRLYELDALEK